MINMRGLILLGLMVSQSLFATVCDDLVGTPIERAISLGRSAIAKLMLKPEDFRKALLEGPTPTTPFTKLVEGHDNMALAEGFAEVLAQINDLPKFRAAVEVWLSQEDKAEQRSQETYLKTADVVNPILLSNKAYDSNLKLGYAAWIWMRDKDGKQFLAAMDPSSLNLDLFDPMTAEHRRSKLEVD